MQIDGPALLVAAPGRLRDGWQALLKAMPQISDVQQADDLPSALWALDRLGPGLVILDAGPFGAGAWYLLRQVKASKPQCRCIALVCNSWQERDAWLAGADGVLLRGFTGEEMFIAVKGLFLEGSNT
jgi:DNA-binding NarL/FixJ family response regulator